MLIYVLGMPNVLVIKGHPDSSSLSSALADAYAQAAVSCGATLTCLDLAQLKFDPILRRGYKEEQALEPDLVAASAALRAAQHVAWFFPMWWGGPPALVKGFVERVFTPGYAFRYRGRNQMPVKLLSGRSARLVSSMDSPLAWYTLALRRALHAAFGTGTLSFVGFAPIRTSMFYELRFRSEIERKRAFEQVQRAAAQDCAALPAAAASAASLLADAGTDRLPA
jgi:putative NADPH-quinone reductase